MIIFAPPPPPPVQRDDVIEAIGARLLEQTYFMSRPPIKKTIQMFLNNELK